MNPLLPHRYISQCMASILLAAMSLSVFIICSLTACSSSQHPVECGTFDVDSVVFERTSVLADPQENDPLSGRSRFSAVVDIPSKTNQTCMPVLYDSVSTWISLQLLPNDTVLVMGRKVLDVAANVFFGDVDGNEWGEELDITMHKVYEDERFLTYEIGRYYYTGGAHGFYGVSGATFEKVTGKRVTWSDVDRNPELRIAITEQLQKTKGVENDSLFAKMLLIKPRDYTLEDGTLALPLPKVAPWLGSTGWVFTYQPYEILPWCHGAPACSLPREIILP